MVDLRAIDYLRRVYQFQSVRLAAESVPVSPTTISAAIHKLENNLKIKLLERTYRGVELTEMAKQVVKLSDNLFDELRLFEHNISLLTQLSSPKIENKQEKINAFIPGGWWQHMVGELYDYTAKENLNCQFYKIKYTDDYIEKINSDSNSLIIDYFSPEKEQELKKYKKLCSIKIASMRPNVIFAKNSKYLPRDTMQVSIQELSKFHFLRFEDEAEAIKSLFDIFSKKVSLQIEESYSSSMAYLKMISLDKGVGMSCGKPKDEYQGDEWVYIPILTEYRSSLLIVYNEDIDKNIIYKFIAPIKRIHSL